MDQGALDALLDSDGSSVDDIESSDEGEELEMPPVGHVSDAKMRDDDAHFGETPIGLERATLDQVGLDRPRTEEDSESEADERSQVRVDAVQQLLTSDPCVRADDSVTRRYSEQHFQRRFGHVLRLKKRADPLRRLRRFLPHRSLQARSVTPSVAPSGQIDWSAAALLSDDDESFATDHDESDAAPLEATEAAECVPEWTWNVRRVAPVAVEDKADVGEFDDEDGSKDVALLEDEVVLPRGQEKKEETEEKQEDVGSGLLSSMPVFPSLGADLFSLSSDEKAEAPTKTLSVEIGPAAGTTEPVEDKADFLFALPEPTAATDWHAPTPTPVPMPMEESPVSEEDELLSVARRAREAALANAERRETRRVAAARLRRQMETNSPWGRGKSSSSHSFASIAEEEEGQKRPVEVVDRTGALKRARNAAAEVSLSAEAQLSLSRRHPRGGRVSARRAAPLTIHVATPTNSGARFGRFARDESAEKNNKSGGGDGKDDDDDDLPSEYEEEEEASEEEAENYALSSGAWLKAVARRPLESGSATLRSAVRLMRHIGGEPIFDAAEERVKKLDVATVMAEDRRLAEVIAARRRLTRVHTLNKTDDKTRDPLNFGDVGDYVELRRRQQASLEHFFGIEELPDEIFPTYIHDSDMPYIDRPKTEFELEEISAYRLPLRHNDYWQVSNEGGKRENGMYFVPQAYNPALSKISSAQKKLRDHLNRDNPRPSDMLELSATAGELLIAEYMEEYPLFVSKPGMASHLLYFRRHPRGQSRRFEIEQDEEGDSSPTVQEVSVSDSDQLDESRKMSDGEIDEKNSDNSENKHQKQISVDRKSSENLRTLEEGDSSPFKIGDIRSGETVAALVNNMCIAPVQEHISLNEETDFLVTVTPPSWHPFLGQEKGKKMSTRAIVREMPRIVTVGQQQPLMALPNPKGRSASKFFRARIRHAMLKQFEKQYEQKQQQHARFGGETSQEQRVTVQQIADMFPEADARIISEQFEALGARPIRRGTNLASDGSRRGLAAADAYALRVDLIPAKRRQLVDLVTPEQCCVSDRAKHAEFLLSRLNIHDINWSPRLEGAFNRLIDVHEGHKKRLGRSSRMHAYIGHRSASFAKAARFVMDQLRTTPWELVRQFIKAQGGVQNMRITGLGNPLDDLIGFSFLKSERSPDQSERRREMLQRVTGTRADLRRLAPAEAVAILVKLGVTRKHARSLSRWQRSEMIQRLATEQEWTERGSEFGRFARPKKLKVLQRREYLRVLEHQWRRHLGALRSVADLRSTTKDIMGFASDLVSGVTVERDKAREEAKKTAAPTPSEKEQLRQLLEKEEKKPRAAAATAQVPSFGLSTHGDAGEVAAQERRQEGTFTPQAAPSESQQTVSKGPTKKVSVLRRTLTLRWIDGSVHRLVLEDRDPARIGMYQRDLVNGTRTYPYRLKEHADAMRKGKGVSERRTKALKAPKAGSRMQRCRKCGEIGHSKRNCKVWRAEQEGGKMLDSYEMLEQRVQERFKFAQTNRKSRNESNPRVPLQTLLSQCLSHVKEADVGKMFAQVSSKFRKHYETHVPEKERVLLREMQRRVEATTVQLKQGGDRRKNERLQGGYTGWDDFYRDVALIRRNAERCWKDRDPSVVAAAQRLVDVADRWYQSHADELRRVERALQNELLFERMNGTVADLCKKLHEYVRDRDVARGIDRRLRKAQSLEANGYQLPGKDLPFWKMLLSVYTHTKWRDVGIKTTLDRAEKKEYRSFLEWRDDLWMMLHNLYLYFGDESDTEESIVNNLFIQMRDVLAYAQNLPTTQVVLADLYEDDPQRGSDADLHGDLPPVRNSMDRVMFRLVPFDISLSMRERRQVLIRNRRAKERQKKSEVPRARARPKTAGRKKGSKRLSSEEVHIFDADKVVQFDWDRMRQVQQQQQPPQQQKQQQQMQQKQQMQKQQTQKQQMQQQTQQMPTRAQSMLPPSGMSSAPAMQHMLPPGMRGPDGQPPLKKPRQ